MLTHIMLSMLIARSMLITRVTILTIAIFIVPIHKITQLSLAKTHLQAAHLVLDTI